MLVLLNVEGLYPFCLRPHCHLLYHNLRPDVIHPRYPRLTQENVSFFAAP